MIQQILLRVAVWLPAAALGAVPMILALAGPAILWDQGCFEQETTTFVRQYTAADGRSILQKVFDPHANDLGTYQARELSYLIDLTDAYAYPYLAAIFGPGFSLPLSSFLASMVLVTVFLAGIRHHAPRVGRLTATLLLSCFVTSFCFVATLGMFYRSAKPVLAATTVGWICLFLYVLRRGDAAEARGSQAAVAGLFVLTLVAGLLDRQGAFMAMVAGGLVVVHAHRTGDFRDVAAIVLLGVLLVEAYNVLIGPRVIEAFNGYSPDFSYQRIPARELIRLPHHLLRSASLLGQNALLMFGGNWIVSGLVGALAFGMIRRASRQMRSRCGTAVCGGRTSRFTGYLGWILLSQLVMFALMIARHGYVYRWIDHRFWYYPLPFLALLLCGALLALNRWMPALTARQQRLVPAVLALVVVSNVLSFGHRLNVMVEGPWFSEIYPQCQLLKASLRAGEADPALEPAYRLMFDHGEAAQAAIR